MKKIFSILLLLFAGTFWATTGDRKWIANSVSAAPLYVHPDNPRYFADGSGKAIYMTGSHTWSNLVDLGPTDPPVPFEFDRYLNFLSRNNHNFIRLWAWALPKCHPASFDLWYAVPFPWARTGPGIASDGKPKFDLDQFDQSYFDRLRSRAIAAGNRGIYVSIMFFEGNLVQPEANARVSNDGYPFESVNNINGIHAPGGSAYSLQDPAVAAIQKAYIRKIVDTVNDLDNVLYEIVNEAPNTSKHWQYDMIAFTKNYELTKPKQHPVGITPYFYGRNADLFDSFADWMSPYAEPPYADGYYVNDPPPATGKKVIITDTDHLGRGDGDWVWKSFTRGLNPILMDWYDVGTPVEHWYSAAQQEAMRQQMGYTLGYANRIDLPRMIPRGDLSSTGYALANPGKEYLVYQPSTVSFTVHLDPGIYNYEWFNPAAGRVVETGTIHAAAGTQAFAPAFFGSAVLYLKTQDPDLQPLIGVLENPGSGQVVSGITTIHGWALDGKHITKVELFVDGSYAADIPYGGTRKDVQQAYPAYPNSEKSGFAMAINYSILTSGSHAIKVRLHNQDGHTRDLDAFITVKKAHGEFITNVDQPAWWLRDTAVTVGDITRHYDFKIEWSNATQGFVITDVLEK